MKEQLVKLGVQMDLEPMPFYPEPLPLDEEGFLNESRPNALQASPSALRADALQQATISSHTASRSVHNVGYAEDLGESSSPQTYRPHKRPRVDTPFRPKNANAAPSSRDKMPPPSKTISRMRSVRNFLPASVRQRFSSRGKVVVSQVSPPARMHGSDVQMFKNVYCEPVDPPAQPSSGRGRPPTRHGAQQEPYMSGALPVENIQQVALVGPAQSLHCIGPNSNGAEFTFRSMSPMKLDDHRSSKLPTQPSYLRLMDGLSNDTRLNLGLQDPRGRAPDQMSRTTQVAQRSDASYRGRASRQHDASSYSYGSQSPRKGTSPSPGYHHLGSLRSHKSDASMGDTRNRGSWNPTTPAPARFRPTQEVENVVSPFFKSSNCNPPQFSRASVAERHISITRSNDYPSHQQWEPELGPESTSKFDWREGRSLNGLSFFNSPLNERNEPINLRHEERSLEYASQTQRHHSRNVTSKGFIRRPDHDSPYTYDSSYRTVEKPSYSSQQHVQRHPAIPSQSFSRTSHSCALPPPTATHTIVRVRNRSPARAHSNLTGLERAGVRSSRVLHTPNPDNTCATPVTNVFAGSGRRAVRR
jgi:hypothetical protein